MKPHSNARRERRNFVRYSSDEPGYLTLLVDAQRNPIIASIRDISISGCQVAVEGNLPDQKSIGIQTKDAPSKKITADIAWRNWKQNDFVQTNENILGIKFAQSEGAREQVSAVLRSLSSDFRDIEGLESKIGDQLCVKCVLSLRVPGVTFDSNGLCNFCVAYKRSEASSIENTNYEALERILIQKLKSNPRKHQYDCLCLYSGGKDSTYMLYMLVKKFKLRVLAFTFDNYFIAPETNQNMKKVLTNLNVDHILFKPAWETNKSLFRTGMIHSEKTDSSKELSFMMGHACWPCFTQISMQSIKLALDKNIPNIVVGTTPGQIRQKKYSQTAKFSGILDVYRAMVIPMLKLLQKTSQSDVKKALEIPFYRQLQALRMTLVPFYEYVYYNERLVIDTVKNEIGWEAPLSTDSCSTNCHLNSLGIQIHKNKHGISPYMIPLSRDVREGLVGRNDAVRALSSDLNESLVKSIARQFEVQL